MVVQQIQKHYFTRTYNKHYYCIMPNTNGIIDESVMTKIGLETIRVGKAQN